MSAHRVPPFLTYPGYMESSAPICNQTYLTPDRFVPSGEPRLTVMSCLTSRGRRRVLPVPKSERVEGPDRDLLSLPDGVGPAIFNSHLRHGRAPSSQTFSAMRSPQLACQTSTGCWLLVALSGCEYTKKLHNGVTARVCTERSGQRLVGDHNSPFPRQ